LWVVETGQTAATIEGHSGDVWALALSADGRLVATGSFDGAVRLWEVATGRQLATLEGHTGGAWSVALSDDGELVASGSFDGTIRLWDARSRSCRRTLRSEQRFERVDIAGLTGITEAQRAVLIALGAVERSV